MYNKTQAYVQHFAASPPKLIRTSIMESSTLYTIVASVVALVLSVISVYSVLLTAFGILPGLVAVIIDQDKNRYISKIVMLYNITGLAPYLVKILQSSSPNAIAIDIIVDPHSWMIIFSSAALGWTIYWIFPQVAIFIYTFKINLRISDLETELKSLTSEWGNEITIGKVL